MAQKIAILQVDTEAKYLRSIQSPTSTCTQANINPHFDLTNALQRVAVHRVKDVANLTSRIWREVLGNSPMRSEIDELKA